MTSGTPPQPTARRNRSTRRVLLVGMMGAGKTTVGCMLARRLGWRYIDSDAEVEAFTGHTVKELFAAGGEEAFRPVESEALATALDGAEPAVVSVAGGAVLDRENRELLRHAGTVVWLRATPATLLERVRTDATVRTLGPDGSEGPDGLDDLDDLDGNDGRDDHRPLLEHDPAGTLERLDRVRRPLYEEVADVVVDVDDLAPEAVVDRVLAQVQAART